MITIQKVFPKARLSAHLTIGLIFGAGFHVALAPMGFTLTAILPFVHLYIGELARFIEPPENPKGTDDIEYKETLEPYRCPSCQSPIWQITVATPGHLPDVKFVHSGLCGSCNEFKFQIDFPNLICESAEKHIEQNGGNDK